MEGEQSSFINDPENYRLMSQPFENGEAANKALDAFFEAVREARQKHRIADVVVLAMVSAGEKDAKAIAQSTLGDDTNVEGICAWAYGRAAAEREARMASLHRQGRKAGVQ